MKNKNTLTRLFSLVMILALSLSLSSCISNTQVTEAGDVYNVEVNGADASVAAASKAVLSAVSITSTYRYASLGGVNTASSKGSGVIYSMNEERNGAFIVTNYHVVYNSSLGISENINVFLYGMEAASYVIPATYIGGSMLYDIAVLKIENSDILKSSSSVPAVFANSDSLRLLDKVIAVGNASGSGISATLGHLNVESEYISLFGADDKTKITLRVMRTDAAVNPGNSGGGLFNAKGEVIGIVNAKNANEDVDNIGYAIPSNVAKSIVENLIYYCDGTDKTCVYRCILGVTVGATNLRVSYDEESGSVTKLEDVVIESVVSGSPASKLFARGDVVKSITVGEKSYEITRQHQLIDAMLDVREGTSIKYKVIRGGEEIEISVTATADMLEAYV